MAHTPGDLGRDTAAVARPAPGDAAAGGGGGGGWTIDLPDTWDYQLPSGGVLQTASLRAAVAELGDADLRLVSCATIFCTPVAPGRLDADVTVLRRGGSVAQVRVAVRARDAVEPGLETVATFARDRVGPDVVGARPLAVPRPAACPPLVEDDGPGAARLPRFFRNFDCRLAAGDRFWDPGWTAGPARSLRWYRYRVPPRDAAGRLDRLALPPVIDIMPPALVQAIGPGGYRFFAPSLDLTVHVVDDTDREWLLIAAYARRARAGYAIAEVEVWDDADRLLAYGTQCMYIRGLAGTPPTGVVAPPDW
ncbi:MAG: thioesterase family protein [Kofleriaceae bacterium]|nr:thioesterase family protein [Kofleriaceae bacterium]